MRKPLNQDCHYSKHPLVSQFLYGIVSRRWPDLKQPPQKVGINGIWKQNTSNHIDISLPSHSIIFMIKPPIGTGITLTRAVAGRTIVERATSFESEEHSEKYRKMPFPAFLLNFQAGFRVRFFPFVDDGSPPSVATQPQGKDFYRLSEVTKVWDCGALGVSGKGLATPKNTNEEPILFRPFWLDIVRNL